MQDHDSVHSVGLGQSPDAAPVSQKGNLNVLPFEY